MSANYNTFNLIRQTNTFGIVLEMLGKYGIDLKKIAEDIGPFGYHDITDVLIKYLTKFETIDIINHNINKEIVRMIGTAMFTHKL